MDGYIKLEDAIKATTYVGTAEPTDIIPLTLYAAQKNIRKIPAVDVVPKSEYDELKAMLDAAVAGQETLQEALAEAKSEVARRIFEEMEQSTFGDSAANLIIMPTKDFTKLKKKFCVAEQDSDSRQTVENEKKYMEEKV